MQKYKEIADGGENLGFPPLKQMRELQQRGAEGTGFDESYADKMAARNHGTGLGEGEDQKFPENADDGSGSPLEK